MDCDSNGIIEPKEFGNQVWVGDRLNDGQGGRAGKYYGFGDKKSPDTWTLPAEFNERPHKKPDACLRFGGSNGLPYDLVQTTN